MAFDGTTIAAVRKELSDSILGGRIYKNLHSRNQTNC